jgi:2',3'-cyclic-nucleotide 2'-phosphodiesterase (5'-nucleotidase family)
MRPKTVLTGLTAIALAAARTGAGSLPAAPSTVAAAPIQVLNELSTRNVRTEESNLADIIVDAIRDVEKTDAALIAASSFTDVVIAKGTTTPADILKALEYQDDNIVVVKLTGAQLRRALEHGLTLLPQKNSAFLQVSGIGASIDPGAEKDKRVTALRVGGSAVKDTATYTVAMPSPLANGALGYFKIWDKKAIDHDTNKTLGRAVNDFLAGVRSVGAKGEERLAIKR